MLRLNGYLLDTNHLDAYFSRNQRFMSHLEPLAPERQIIWTSAISLGEIEAGYRITPNHDPQREADFRRFIQREFVQSPNFVLPVDENTRTYYGDIVGRICNAHPGRNPRQRTEAFLNAQSVDINDVWIFATAWAHNLTLLTHDSMTEIRRIVTDSEVPVRDWL
jgi:predicted nucleic acid-binding protein